MSALEIGIWSFPVLMGLIFLRVPIGLSMFLVGLGGLVMVTGDTVVAFGRLKNETYSTFSSYSLSIIPMFFLMGQFATLGGMSTALFKAAEGFIGHRKGGVAKKSDIAKGFKIKGYDRIGLKARLKEMVASGTLETGKHRTIKIPASLPPVATMVVTDIDDGDVLLTPKNWDGVYVATSK